MIHSLTPATILVTLSLLVPLATVQADSSMGPKGGSLSKWPQHISAVGLPANASESNLHAGPKGGVTSRWRPHMSPSMPLSAPASVDGRGPKGGPVGRWH